MNRHPPWEGCHRRHSADFLIANLPRRDIVTIVQGERQGTAIKFHVREPNEKRLRFLRRFFSFLLSPVEQLVRENSRRYSASRVAHQIHPSCPFLFLLSWKTAAFEQNAEKSCKKVEKLSSFFYSLFIFLVCMPQPASAGGIVQINFYIKFPLYREARVNQRTQLIGGWLQYFADFQYPISSWQRTAMVDDRCELPPTLTVPSRAVAAISLPDTESSPFYVCAGRFWDLSTFHRVNFHKANRKIVFVLLLIRLRIYLTLSR